MKKQFGYFILAGSLIFAGCGKKEQTASPKPAQDSLENNSSGNPLTAPADYLGAVVKAKKSADKVIDTVSINKAIELFNVQEGRYPTDLNELVTQKYLGALPTPPHGTKIVYDAAAGKVKVVPQ